MPPDATAGAPARLRWADVAKGACILLVVLHHGVTKQYLPLLPAGLEPVGQAWLWLTMALKPVRMPLFFLLSGFFASSALQRPWPLVARRVWSPAYVYVVWLVLLGLFFTVERELPMNRTQDLTDLALDLLFASTGLWFLYALAVYFLLARLLAPLPASPVVVVAASVGAMASLLPIDEANRTSVLVHFVFFFVGARLPDVVRALAERRGPGALPALTVTFVAVSASIGALGLPLSLEVVVLSLLGLPWGVQLAAHAATSEWLAASLAWVGRRTLPIYVLHVALLGVLHHLPGGTSLGPDLLAWPLSLAYPVLLTAVVVALALLVHAALVRVGLGVLFTLPSRRERPAVRTAAPEPVHQN